MVFGSTSSETTAPEQQGDDKLNVDETVATDSPANDESTAEESTNVVELTEDWEAKYNALHDQHLRLAADFENNRKRHATDRESLLKYGSQQTIDQLLPVLDNLQRAADSLTENSEPKMLYQSFNMLSVQLLDTLSSVGLKKIDTAGKTFDPKFHDAVQQLPSPTHAENEIIHEQQSGYMLHERVLRPAQVIVAAAPAVTEETPVKPELDIAVDGENPFANNDGANDEG
jgi:molecular chaperone GrpE